MSPSDAAFRRVLFALDASRDSRRALASLADIATRLQAELVCLFVEDENLLRMAALPMTKVFSSASSGSDLDVETLERALRGAAAESRAFLEGIARQSDVRCAFRVVRGVVASEVVARSDVGDLVVVDRRTAAAAWSSIVADVRGAILVLDARAALGDSLIAVYPAEEAWEQGVAGIARLAEVTGRRLAVIRPADAEAVEFERRLTELLAGSPIGWEIVAPDHDAETLARAVRARPGTVLAVPSSLVSLTSGEDIEALLQRTGCSMLVVR